jgi:DNA-directed RNA polymerase specialized sigma24 family protein
MSSSPDVTHWVRQLQAGDRAAVQKLWEGYHRRLVALARKKLGGSPRRAADEEDVVLSAFDSFCRGAEQGRFPRLEDRDDLWQLLVMITTRKAADLVTHEARDKRDWRRLQNGTGDPHDNVSIMRELLGREPEPSFAAEVADECQRLLGLLPDEKLRQTAVLKLDGHTNEEIAVRMEVAPKTIERWLRLIRKHWQGEMDS